MLSKFFFPISRNEMKAFFLLASLMFFIIFNNTMVRNLKDCFLVMNNGALSLAFIKLWGVLPATLLALLIFSKISNLMKQENVFYVFVLAFLAFFALFGFVILPNQEIMPLHRLADWLRIYLPSTFENFIGLIEYWNYSLYYIFSELWSSIVVSMLFWQFANAVVRKDDAKRFYPLFGVIADIGMILAGVVLVVLTNQKVDDHLASVQWQDSVKTLTYMIVVSGLCSLVIYFLANRFFEKSLREQLQTQQKTELSIKESISFLAASPNIRHLALIVLGFAITSNLIEITWKCQMEEICENMTDFTHLMGYFSILTGLLTITLVMIGGNILRVKGWLFAALIPPFFMLIVGILFYGMLIVEHQVPFFIFGYSGTFIVTIVGSLENIMGKSVKFSLFDPTKEMAFIPLDIESKLKGKATIDMFGVRLGKSMGSLVHQGIAVFFGTFQSALMLYLSIFTLVIGVWIYSIKQLYDNYIKKYAY